MRNLLAAAVLLTALTAAAQDTVEFLDGRTRNGQIIGMDEKVFRLRLPPPMPGQPAGTVNINRNEVDRITFGPDADLETLRKDPVIARTAFARLLWQKREPFLSIPESRAAEAGMLYGQILLLSSDTRRHEEALELFTKIEQEAWNETDRERATRGRLQAMLRMGRLDEASREAQALADAAEDPALLLDTKLLLAQTRIANLRELLEENPRWEEDVPVRAERNRLLNDALDLALYPFLFHGTSHEQAAQGLWLARETYLLAGDTASAREVATDIVAIYPHTRFAGPAGKALEEKNTSP